MNEKRFTIEKDYDCDGNWEYCYQDNETGRIFNFADDFCSTDFLELVNAIINNLKKENKELKASLYAEKTNIAEVVNDYAKQFKRHSAQFGFMMDLAEDLEIDVKKLEALDD